MKNDPLLWNKIAASVLTAGLLAMVVGEVAGILYSGDDHAMPEEEQAFVIAPGEEQESQATAEPSAPAGPEPIAPLLADADASSGESVARKCGSCHSFEQGGPDKVGPNLYNTLGSDIAASEGFNYSDALTGLEGEWTYDKLNQFLYDPQGYASGTRMTFNGVKDGEDRADLIAYMRSMADSPPPLPEPEEAAAEEASGGETGADARAASDDAAGEDTGEDSGGDAGESSGEQSEGSSGEQSGDSAGDDAGE